MMRNVLSACLFLILIAAPLSGATILVRDDGTGDQPTIQAAVTVSVSGDTILLAGGTFSGPGNRDIQVTGKHLHILSESDDFSSCIVDLGGYPGLNMTSATGSATLIRGIGFTGGAATQGGGIFANMAWLIIENCRFETNSASSNGGGIYASNSTCWMYDCTIKDNYGRYGGGIYAEGSSLLLERCEIEGNTAETGAGSSINTSGSATIRDCLIIGNQAQNFGGGISNNSPGTYLYNCTIVQNGAGSDGGGIYNHGSGFVGIDHTIISLTTAGGTYGGSSQIYTIACSDFFGNAGGDWPGPLSGYNGINGNLNVDPMFCAAYNPSDPWTLDSNSPAFTAPCGTMGAKDYAGCGVVGIEESSWGDIKNMHR
jgi:predicted outer membrane repeat protein